MRFSTVHEVASYLVVAAGFAALALSGELSPIVLVATLVLGALSLLVSPARTALVARPAWSLASTALTVVAVALLGLSALGDGRYVLFGAHSLCVLLVNKLWNRRSARDYLQAYVISFLMLVAGTVLNTDLAFAGCFFVYVIAATWALALLHLRRAIEERDLRQHGGGGSAPVAVARVLSSKRIVGGGFLLGTSAISASVFVVSGAFFFLFPRVGFGVFATHSRRGLQVGWSDRGVELGQNGLVKDNEQVVMRVEPETHAPPPAPLYFRGISFDRYEGGRWSSASGAKRAELKRWAGYTIVDVPRSVRLRPDDLERRLDGATSYDIYLEPLDSEVLFVAERPLAIALGPAHPGGPPPLAPSGAFLDDEARFATGDVYASARQAGVKYTAWSRLADAKESALLAAAAPDGDATEILARYLDVSHVPEEVLALGRRLTARAKSPFDKTMAVERYLRANYRYTLDLRHDERKEPLAEFLFERRAGHCEYFASAMAILLRAGGVPTRHVAGFYGGQWNEVGRYLAVRQRDAHAWVEVWLGDDLGWVHFDPTPPSPASPARSRLSARLRELLDVAQLTWFKYVIEYDLTTQMDLLARLRQAAAPSPASKAGASGALFTRARLRRAGEAAGAIGLLVAAGMAWRRRRRRPDLGQAGRVPRRVVSALARSRRAIVRRGIAPLPSETPRALGARARAAGDPGALAFQALVELFYAARFGGHAVDEERARALAEAVVNPPPEAGRTWPPATEKRDPGAPDRPI